MEKTFYAKGKSPFPSTTTGMQFDPYSSRGVTTGSTCH